jgi:hypothetical protein
VVNEALGADRRGLCWEVCGADSAVVIDGTPRAAQHRTGIDESSRDVRCVPQLAGKLDA